MSDEQGFTDPEPALRRFLACPICGGVREAGYTGIWFRWDKGEVWLMDGTYPAHWHVAQLPAPERLAEGFTW